MGPIGYGRPDSTHDLLEETDLLVFVGTVPGDVITDGFTIRQNWDKKNFIVTIDPSLRGRSGPVTHQIVSKPESFIRDLVRIDLPVRDAWKKWTQQVRQDRWSSPLPHVDALDGQARWRP